MSPRGEDRGGGARPASVLRRIGRAAFSPWRLLRIEESLAAIRRDFHDLSAGGQAGASRMRLDETGVFDLDASSFLHGQRRAAFEDALILRQGSTARNAWICLGLGALFFLGWLYRLMTMTWTGNATLTALQFTPACAVFFLLAFRFGLENYQIRMRRKATAMEYLSAASGFWPR
jgi:hypothetical protein